MSSMSKISRVHRSTASGTRHEREPKATKMPSLECSNKKNQVIAQSTTRRTCFLRSTLLCLAITALVIVRYPSFIKHNTHSKGDIKVKFDTITTPLHPEREKIKGRNHFYMLPHSNATADGKPKGILVYLHSCKQSGLEFFTLPEHRIIAHNAIQKGLVVFSPTSYDRESGCYTSEDANGYLVSVVKEFLRNHRLRQLPRVGLGDSSGGAFLSLVHQALNLESMAVYNSPWSYDDLKIQEEQPIPTVYLTMSTDRSISSRMNANKIKLQEMNISSYLYNVSPRPFTESLCTARLPEISDGFCEHIFEIIEKDHSNLLDADGFILEGDVKSTQWQRCLKRIESDYRSVSSMDGAKIFYDNELNSLPRSTQSWFRVALEQEIQTCFGFHAMTAQFHDEIIQFLISNSKMKGDPAPIQ